MDVINGRNERQENENWKQHGLLDNEADRVWVQVTWHAPQPSEVQGDVY